MGRSDGTAHPSLTLGKGSTTERKRKGFRRKSEIGRFSIISPTQWQLVRDARLEALDECPEAFLGSFDEESLYHEDDWKKTFENASWHGCLRAGRLVAIAKSRILLDYSEERYVESLWIAPEFRGKGCSRELMAQIAREARGDGRKYIRLAVLRGNRSGLAAFLRLGFVPLAERSDEDEVCLEAAILGEFGVRFEDDGLPERPRKTFLGRPGLMFKRLRSAARGRLSV